jgi:hypothetical protein
MWRFDSGSCNMIDSPITIGIFSIDFETFFINYFFFKNKINYLIKKLNPTFCWALLIISGVVRYIKTPAINYQKLVEIIP